MLAIRCIVFSSAHAKTYSRQLKFQRGEILSKLHTRDCSVSVDNKRLRMGNYWLLKTEPDCWSWDNQTANKGLSVWDGVRNHQAQKAMRNMAESDLCFFYHTGKLKEVCGIVRVVKTFYPDPTDDTGKWGAVDVQELLPMKSSVKLAQMKEDKQIVDFLMFRQPRLSVVPVEEDVWRRVCALGEVEPPLLDSTGSTEPKEESCKGSKKRAPEPKPEAVVAEKQERKRPARGRKKSADDGEIIEEPAEVTRKQSSRTKPKPTPTAVAKEDEQNVTNGKKSSSTKSKTVVNGNGIGEKAQPVKAGRKRRNDPKPAAAVDEEEEKKKKPPSKAIKKRANQTKAAPAEKPRRRPPPKKSKKAAQEIEVQSDSTD